MASKRSAPRAKGRRPAAASRRNGSSNGGGNGRGSEAVSNPDFERYCRETFGPASMYAKPEVLKGVRVLSCTQYILGPSCAAYLGELGAEVIKVEAPRRGEPMRHSTPGNEGFLYPLSRWVPQSGTGLGFFGANFNEQFVSMDFHRPEARELMYKLAAKSDIMVENFRPGTFDRWGIGYRQLREVNPRLIYVWCGGFGGWGPGRVRASYDILGQAQGGAFAITGQPEELGGSPAKHTIWLADYWGGMMAATHALAALFWRDNVSGEGTFLEFSQVHGVSRQLEYALPLYGRYGVIRERWGNWDTELCVHGIIRCGKSSYPTSDNPQEKEEGYILVSAYEDEDFARVCRTIGKSELARVYKTHDVRVRADSQREIYKVLEEWAADKTKEQVAQALDRANIINQPVWNAREVASHPHWRERGAVFWMDDPTYGDLLSQGSPFKMSETPPRVKWALKPIGADNESVYGRLCGLSAEEIQKLESDEVI
jgi:crotonobetainyl-CoA:carnitine CoA-transferase CaiB-like acyl-CoA transferase